MKRQATFNVSIAQLNKNSYQIKSLDQRLLGMVWEQRNQYWPFFALELQNQGPRSLTESERTNQQRNFLCLI